MAYYLELKDRLLRGIVDGTYELGGTLPTEHELCGRYGVSRVTVRKALDELKKDGLLVGVPRQGTVVVRRGGGYRGSLDIIALVAAVQDPFFAAFMEHFEREAEEHGSLMLFKQDFQGRALQSEGLFYRFIQKNIRNVVLWPQTPEIDFGLLDRLRAVGMNFVFFDQAFDTAAADSVCLDNRLAVETLCKELRKMHRGPLLYIDYLGPDIPSARERREAFLAAGGGRVFGIPRGGDDAAEVARLLVRLAADGELPAGIVCNSGGIGLLAAKWLRAQGLAEDCPLATVDYMAEMDEYPMLAYEQPMDRLAETAYRRLVAQTNEGDGWRADSFRLPGRMIRCGRMR